MSSLAVVVDGFLPSGSCYDAGYIGTYAGHSLYVPNTADCSLEAASFQSVSEHVSALEVTIPYGAEHLVWITDASLEPEILEELKAKTDWSALRQAAEALWPTPAELEGSGVQQELLDTQSFDYNAQLVYQSSNALLVALRSSKALAALDISLPPHQRMYTIPYPPTPLLPVPNKDITRVRSLLSTLAYNHSIARLVNVLNVAQMNLDIAWLTGEAKASRIESRHSFHPGAVTAALWLRKRMEMTGAKCDLRPFQEGFAPNVICRYEGTEDTSELVLLSAHYDSRGSFGQTRAPGGDDDGSGTTAILSIARAIGTTGIKFKKNVELCLFAGEEQGLVGSRAYAREMRKEDADIVLMIQADMLAYHKPGEPPQLGLPDIIGTPEVTQLVANISALYSPELEVGFTPACCSDHQSFHEQGFASTQVFERAGPIADPMYHNSGDLSRREGYDFWQLRSIAKVQFATLLHAAGFEI